MRGLLIRGLQGLLIGMPVRGMMSFYRRAGARGRFRGLVKASFTSKILLFLYHFRDFFLILSYLFGLIEQGFLSQILKTARVVYTKYRFNNLIFFTYNSLYLRGDLKESLSTGKGEHLSKKTSTDNAEHFGADSDHLEAEAEQLAAAAAAD